MSIDREFSDFRIRFEEESRSNAEFRGEMREYAKNTTDYITAVNGRINVHLDDHKREHRGLMTAAIGIISSGLTILANRILKQ